MEVKSNRIGDVRVHYQHILYGKYPDREADNLLFMIIEAYTGLPRAKILMDPDAKISESELLKIHWAIKDLLKDKPVQYILGTTDFFGLSFRVNSKVLIPRPETEELVEIVLKTLDIEQTYRILDVGTGSGCIAISLKHFRPASEVVALDVSEFALEVARENAESNHALIEFKRMDILDEAQRSSLGKFDLIISNPPYIPNYEKLAMKRNVLDFEPPISLFVPDDDPLLFYRALLNFSEHHLLSGGSVFCEVNQSLASETAQLFKQSGMHAVQIKDDFKGNKRFVSGKKPA